MFNFQTLRCVDVLFIVPKCFEVIVDLQNQPNLRYVVIVVFKGASPYITLNHLVIAQTKSIKYLGLPLGL
ncbi:hypothetical protein HZH66_012914 [Vespula vulgaris]|uniref:Uncharacterized protein n=1 Tax=Vespula vulgaris TaxID=7454 RepID=A0A834JAS2_VESVU|nr:hypothetical protein HZH66_012914 [Vespula vulgaris]